MFEVVEDCVVGVVDVVDVGVVDVVGDVGGVVSLIDSFGDCGGAGPGLVVLVTAEVLKENDEGDDEEVT